MFLPELSCEIPTTMDLMDRLFLRWPKNDPKPPAAWRAVSGDKEKKTGADELTGVEIQLALAGFREEDVEVFAEGRQLVVRGDNLHREDVDAKWKTRFEKKFYLQERLSLGDSKVGFFDGILSIKVPLQEKDKDRKKLFGG